MTNQWGYINEVDRVHEQRALWYRAHPNQVQAGPPSFQPIPKIQSPLAQLDYAIPAIIYGNGPRRPNVLGRAVVGAIAGGLVGHWFDKRRARKRRELAELKQRLGVGNIS